MTRVILLAGMMLWGGPVLAAGEGCANAMAQSELTQCAHDDWQAQDAALNAAWAKAMAVMQAVDADLPAGERGAADRLRKGQRAWISFRDEACAAEGYLMHGGSAEPMLVYGCMARLTEVRTGDLRLIAEAGY